jgi:hypothetical protein
VIVFARRRSCGSRQWEHGGLEKYVELGWEEEVKVDAFKGIEGRGLR